MTLGDAIVSLSFLVGFGLIFFAIRRALQLDWHLRERHNATWNEIHRFDLQGITFALRFFLLSGWRKLGPDPKVRLYLRNLLVAYVSTLALAVVIVAVGASLPLKIFRYVPAGGGVGGSVVFDTEGP